MIYPLDDYLHNSTFIIPSSGFEEEIKKRKDSTLKWGYLIRRY